MSDLTRSLSKVLAKNCLGEKILLAPSRRIAQQWLSAAVNEGAKAINLRIETPQSLAMNIFTDVLPDNYKVKLLPAILSPQLCGKLLTGENSRSKRAMAQALFNCFRDLSSADISPPELENCPFSSSSEGRKLIDFFSAYKALLAESGYIETPSVMAKAANLICQKPGVISKVRVICPEHYLSSFSADIWKLWNSLPEECRCILPESCSVTPPEQTASSTTQVDQNRRLQLAAVNNNLDIKFTRAKGISAEIAQVFRYCIKNSIPLDQIELLYTNQRSYLPAIVCELDSFDRQKRHGTFLSGLPASFTHPGKLLEQWCKWISENFSQRRFESCLRHGLIELGENSNNTEAAAALGKLAIGLGKDRWEVFLENCGDSDTHTAAALSAAKIFIGDLPDTSEDQEIESAEFYTHAKTIVKKLAPRRTRCDNQARNRLVSTLDTLIDYLKMNQPSPKDMLAQLCENLREIVDRSLVDAMGPQSGKIFIAPLSDGGHSGRKHTFIVGLNDEFFPAGDSQDPILPDLQRSHINDYLHKSMKKSWHRAHYHTEKLIYLLGNLSGTCILSHNSELLTDDRQMFPATILLSVLAARDNTDIADLEALREKCSAEAAYLCGDISQATNETQCLLSASGTETARDLAEKIFTGCFDNIPRGQAAERLYLSEDNFSQYNGDITAEKSDPLRAFSPSGLEMLAKCPRSFFFRYLLGIKPPRKPDISNQQWLDPLDFGTLVHDTLCDFYITWSKKFDQPAEINLDGCEELLQEILNHHIEKFKAKVAISSENAFGVTFQNAQNALRICISADKNYFVATKFRPRYLEAGIGMESGQVDFDGGSGSPAGCELDIQEPIELVAGSGKLKIRGRLDRIDASWLNPDHIAIWDYKTGSAKKFDIRPPFNQGRILQHWLYTKMARAAIQNVKIDTVGYFFLSQKEKGLRKQYSPTELKLSGGDEILSQLRELIAGGNYPATESFSDCSFCDYRTICGDVARVCKASKSVLGNCDDKKLDAFRQLRNYQVQQ